MTKDGSFYLMNLKNPIEKDQLIYLGKKSHVSDILIDSNDILYLYDNYD